VKAWNFLQVTIAGAATDAQEFDQTHGASAGQGKESRFEHGTNQRFD
jgi:hypothetical protein